MRTLHLLNPVQSLLRPMHPENRFHTMTLSNMQLNQVGRNRHQVTRLPCSHFKAGFTLAIKLSCTNARGLLLIPTPTRLAPKSYSESELTPYFGMLLPAILDCCMERHSASKKWVIYGVIFPRKLETSGERSASPFRLGLKLDFQA